MTSRAPVPPPRTTLSSAYRALTRALAMRHGLAATSVVAALLAIAVAAGAGLPIAVSTAWARLALLALLSLAAIVLAVRAFLRARPGFDIYLEEIEQRFPDVRSWLRNALELEATPAPHTSAELAGALRAEAAQRLERVPLATLTPPLEPRRPALTLVCALGGLLVLGIVAPERTARSWHTLLHPGAAAPPVRLEVEPGSVHVSPGGSLTVRARVWGTRQKPRLLRDAGPRPDAVSDGDGVDAGGGARVWRFELVQLTHADRYRVRVAGVSSPRYAIALSGDPQPVSFDIRYRSPAYARLPEQRGVTTRGDLSALAGTRATLEVTFDRDLDEVHATLPGSADTHWTALSPRRWRGEIPVTGDGDWTLAARAPEGAASFRYHITAQPDAPPVLAVRLPEGSLDLPNGQQVALDVVGQDDLGLSQLTLEWRKRADAPWRVLPLAAFAGAPRDMHVAKTWDASGVALVPGETAAFRFALWDNDGMGRQVARSATYELRFPSLSQLYEHVDQQQAGAQQSFEKVAEQVQELQQSLDKMSRQAPSPASSQPQTFERKEEMQQALDRQQNLSQQIDQATQQLRESLTQAAERRAFDEQLTRKLQEVAQLLDQIQSKDFKDALQKMQQALQQLDRQQTDRGLQQWRQQNQQLAENLQRTIDLLKQLRQEEQLQALAQRAEELKRQQDQLNQQTAAAKPHDGAQAKAQSQQQQQAKSQSEQLAKDARDTAQQQSQEPQTQQSLQQAAQELEQQAAPQQQHAAEQMQQQQSSAAQQSGQKASESLERAAQQLSQLAQQHQQQKDQVDLAAVRRAAQDLVSLQRQTEQNLSSEAPTDQRGDRQTDLSEGASRVADSLYQLARHQPFISPKLEQALGRAIQNLSSSGKQMADGNRARAETEGKSASQALNEAVLELRQSENSMCNKPGTGNKAAQQGQGNVPMQMTHLGEQQGRLNENSRNLSQRLSQQMRLSAGDQEELQRMAEEQARIRSQLAEIQREDEQKKQLLGRLDQTQKDMQDVEESLRRGETGGDVEEKQQHILSRLLDASRSVNRRDFDPQRESRPGVDVPRPSPDQLPADMLRAHDQLQVDLLKAQADRYPAQYRAFIERYLESLNRSPR